MPTQTSLIVGASRGLGLAREHLRRGWNVVATVRGLARTPLHDLAERLVGRVEIDVVDPDQIGSPRLRLGERRFDLLFPTPLRSANALSPIASSRLLKAW